MMMMMMMCGSCYIVESVIFVLPMSFRTYSVMLYMHAVGDVICHIITCAVGFIYEYLCFFYV